MNAIFRGGLALILLLTISSRPAVAAEKPAGFRLTVELRDGSRVVGLGRDKKLEFRSPVLGELKLPLEKIRFVEAQAGTNRYKLTTASDDSLLVAFTMDEVRVETAYGVVKLPAGMIKTLRVSVHGGAGRPTDGLIGLWSGEGNAVDAVTGNSGSLRNVSFTDGVAGQAFSFAPDNFPYGTYTGVQIPDRPAYVLTKSLTIESWVRPRGNGYIILSRGDHRPGMDPYTLSMQANHTLRFQICGPAAESTYIDTQLAYGVWTHVAAVLDGDAGTLRLYTNGVLAAQADTRVVPIGELIPGLSPGLGIGNLNDGGNNFPFIGDLDEVGLYNRALAVEEINAIYNENSAHADGRAELFPARSNIRMPMHSGFPGYYPRN